MKKYLPTAKDKKLLALFEKNPRLSFAKIGHSIGISKEVVHYRLKKMITSGFIRRFFIIIDRISYGQKIYRMNIDLQNLQKGVRAEMIKDLRENKNTGLNLFLQSNRDLEILIYVHKAWDFYTFYEKFIKKYGRFVKRKQISIITRKTYLGHRYIHGKNNSITIGEKITNGILDEKDDKLIYSLVEDPRISIINLSKILKLSPSSIVSRMKKLVSKKIIKGFGVVLDKSFLGYSSYRVEILLNDPSHKKNVINYLLPHKFITKINEFVGENDLDFEIDVKSANELDEFLEKLRVELPQIADYVVVNIIED